MAQSPQPKFMSAFASPLVEMQMPECTALNSRLRELFLRWEQDANRPRKGIPTPVIRNAVYESDFALFQNPESDIKELAEFCLQSTGFAIQQLNSYSAKDMSQLRLYCHSWYHVTHQSGYTARHNHPMASWSGVYCVDPGDPVTDKLNSGTLRFLEVRSTAFMYLDPGNAHWYTPFSFGELAFNLRAGQLLLFPSYILHEVAPYYGKRERITVAFNVWVREAGQPMDEPVLRVHHKPKQAEHQS